MKTLSEIVAAVAEFVGGDKAKAKDVVQALRDDAGTKPIAQELINIGNAGKTAELKPKLEEAETALRTANARVTELETENSDLRKNAPNAAAAEEVAKKKYEPLIAAEKTKREKAEAAMKDLRRKAFRSQFESALRKPDDKGIQVGDDDDDLIRKAIIDQYMDRYVEKDDGTEDVLQLDSAIPYDGKNLDEKVAGLVADVRRKVPPKYLMTRTDRGSGTGNGGGGGGGGSYDPVKAGTEMGKAEKAEQGDRSLAFK